MIRTIKNILKPLIPKPVLRLYSQHMAGRDLGGGGERVVIDLQHPLDFHDMDMYQKSHTRRYEFAAERVKPDDVCGDFACGTGYGTVMLANRGKSAVGADINQRVIDEVQKKYRKIENVSFVQQDLLTLSYVNEFDTLVSFETIEHFYEDGVPPLLARFAKALTPGGTFIFSTPYMQEPTPEVLAHSFHLTFNIDEKKITQWLTNAGFGDIEMYYQNYETHDISLTTSPKDFIIGIARKRG